MGSAGAIPAHVLRARRTAAAARAALALCGMVLAVADPRLSAHAPLTVIGFVVILITAGVQLLVPRQGLLKVEESLATAAAILIVGLGDQRVNVLAVLWLAAVTCGVLARGGRVHWIGRATLLGALVLPIVREGRLTWAHAGLCLATVALLLTCGRITQELRALLERARHDADHDGLTGALSRAAFRASLDHVGAHSSPTDPVALLLLDLDNFGQINKSNGHAVGDGVLVSVVSRMRQALTADAIVGRLGGDEFAAIVRSQEPEALARRLLDDLERAGAAGRAVAASAGIARIPRDGRDADVLLRASDVALRVAKGSGKQQLAVYDGEPLADQGPDGARGALSRLIDGEGLSIVVQPIFDLSSGAPHAYEALARFHTGGSTSPLHWFAVADEFGLRDELELACLRAGLELHASRPAGTLLSVNLSGPLLLDSRTHALLRAPPTLAGLILEITENSLLEDSAGMRAAIGPLLAQGMRIAVDDMGAGYSGLRQITTVRPAYLKLDRSLITDTDADPERGALVTALLGYARQTGGYLVAEGVETAAELATLRQLGVPLVQGFYLGRPGPPWPSAQPAAAPGRQPQAEPLGTPSPASAVC